MAAGHRSHLLGAEAWVIQIRPETVVSAGGPYEKVPERKSATVVGGGIAGIAAATVLAERGVTVHLLERESELGGRASAWAETLSDGESFQMERGFHAFFRQYYNLRALLKRVDPNLALLRPMQDYPVLGRDGAVESFSNLAKTPPFNVIQLTHRSPHLRLRDLLKVNVKAAMQMLSFDPERTYESYDDLSARSYLDSLNFPERARSMLFNVFAHSFFNPEEDMSAAELLMMFHFYFMGNPEGLIFDVSTKPFSTAYWQPFARYLEKRGTTIHTDCLATGIRRSKSNWTVETGAASFDSDMVVVATTVPGLKGLVDNSPDLSDKAWREQVGALDLTNAFAVWRLWLDRSTQANRPPFAGTTEYPCLDNISLFHLFEDESASWAARSGGAVVELHAYAVPNGLTEETIKQNMLSGLHDLYPETREAKIIEERFLFHQDCPSFRPGSHARRPTVDSPFPGLALAGDFVKLPFPSALMERAASSGMMAANCLLAPYGVYPEPLTSIPRRGLFASLAR
jgi:isorenieratene synthase